MIFATCRAARSNSTRHRESGSRLFYSAACTEFRVPLLRGGRTGEIRVCELALDRKVLEPHLPRSLIGGEDYPPYKNGPPDYVKIKGVAVKKKLNTPFTP